MSFRRKLAGVTTDHIGQSDIAKALGVTRQAVSNKRRRRRDFPEADVRIDGEPGWLPERLAEIVAWWQGPVTTETREAVTAETPVPAVSFLAADDEPPQRARNCRHRNMRLSKGICPDCTEWVTKSGGQ